MTSYRKIGPRSMVPALLCISLGACTEHESPTGPQARSDSLIPPGMPAYVVDYFQNQTAGVDAIVRTVWTACSDSGTIGMDGTPYAPGVNCRLINVNEYLRRFVVYIPETLVYGPDNPAAVVVMHHGSSGTGEQFLNISGWKEEADEEGFIAVFPTGAVYHVLDTGFLNTKWNDFTLVDDVDLSIQPPGYPVTAPWPADDVLFENRILDDLISLIDIDTTRLFAAGFSNGAGFTGRLAVELSDRIAAAGAMAGGLPQEYVPVERIPVIYAVGTVDDGVLEKVNAELVLLGHDTLAALPLDPDSVMDLPLVPVLLESIALTFDLEPAVYTTVTDSTTFTRFRWATPQTGNADDNVFVFGMLAGVGHQFPRGTRGTRNGNNPLDFDAADRFWAFFEQHTQ
jgi:polyhydroxybutyrate depolymerase